jgi:hypothetical protein
MKWVLAAATLFLAGGLHADTPSDRPEARVTEIDAPPAWDAVMADAPWSKAKPLTLQSPLNIKFSTPPESTQVRLLWCKDSLLVRFDCQDQSIVLLPGSEGATKRDLPYYQADAVEVFLDPIGDGRMYMEFQLSPNGGVFDAIYFCTTTPRSTPNFGLKDDIVNRDLFFIKEWNLPGLNTAAAVWPESKGKGWSAVAAFPAKEILHRMGKTEFAPGMKLKVNLVRFDYFANGQPPVEITNWAPVLGGCAHVSPAGMGTIVLAPRE